MENMYSVLDSLKNSWISQLNTSSLQNLIEFASIVTILNGEEYSEKAIKVTLKFPSFEKSFIISKNARKWSSQYIILHILAYRFSAYEFIDKRKNSIIVKINESYVFLPKSRCALKIEDFVVYETDFVNWILKKKEENALNPKEEKVDKNGKNL